MSTNYKLRIAANQELKSLSGAIKAAKVNSPAVNEFWKSVKIKKDQVDPAFILSHSKESEKMIFYKGVNKGDRLKWSAWQIWQIVDRANQI